MSEHMSGAIGFDTGVHVRFGAWYLGPGFARGVHEVADVVADVTAREIYLSPRYHFGGPETTAGEGLRVTSAFALEGTLELSYVDFSKPSDPGGDDPDVRPVAYGSGIVLGLRLGAAVTP